MNSAAAVALGYAYPTPNSLDALAAAVASSLRGVALRRMTKFMDAVAEHNQVMREVADEQGALFIDLDQQFPQGRALFQDPVHLNDKGTVIKARIIADGLLKGLL